MPCAVCRRQLFFYNLQYWRDTSQKLCFTEFSAYREENKANLSLPLDVQKLKNLSASETFAPLPLLGNSKWRNGVLLAGVLTPVDRRHVNVYSVQRRQYPREAARRLISLPLHGNEIKRRTASRGYGCHTPLDRRYVDLSSARESVWESTLT